MREYNIIKDSIWKRDVKIENEEGLELGNIKWKSAFSYDATLTGRYNTYTTKRSAWTTQTKLMDRRGVEVGALKYNMWKGKTTLTYRGRTYVFKPLNGWYSSFIWEDIEGRKIFSYKPKYWGKTQGTVRIYNNHRDEALNDLLMILGTYFLAIYIAHSSG